MKICKSCAFTVWPRSLSTPLPLQSPKTISTFKCISPTIYHPVVYTARKGRRQLPSENIQLSISNTHLKHRLCVTSWAGGQKGVTSRRMSEKHFMRGYVISLSFVCVCVQMQLMFTCTHVTALELGVCSSAWVIGGLSAGAFWSRGVSTFCVCLPLDRRSLPHFCFVSLCHKLTYLGKVVTNRPPETLSEGMKKLRTETRRGGKWREFTKTAVIESYLD